MLIVVCCACAFDCWVLDVGCYLLGIACCLLIGVCWMLDIEGWMTGWCVLGVWCLVLSVECLM